MIGAVLRNLRTIKRVAAHPIHKGRRASAALRWLRLWAALRLTPTSQIAVPFVEGSVLSWPEAATSVRNCARYSLGEYADMAFCLHVLRPDDLFCDVGANAGVYTVLAGHAVGCKVVAVEPVPRTFDLLMQNVYANSLSGRVDARMIGVGSGPGMVSFTRDLWSFNHVTPKGADTIDVPVETLDAVLGCRIPFALKIDVEGYEAEVLAGAADTLGKVQTVLIEMADEHLARFGATAEGLQGALRAAGLLGPLYYDPDARRLVDRGSGGYNQIFVRDPALIAERLTTSRSYRINGATV